MALCILNRRIAISFASSTSLLNFALGISTARLIVNDTFSSSPNVSSPPHERCGSGLREVLQRFLPERYVEVIQDSCWELAPDPACVLSGISLSDP